MPTPNEQMDKQLQDILIDFASFFDFDADALKAGKFQLELERQTGKLKRLVLEGQKDAVEIVHRNIDTMTDLIKKIQPGHYDGKPSIDARTLQTIICEYENYLTAELGELGE